MKQPELGKRILELRKQKGFTQEELVEQCNISVRTIQRIEAGEVMPRSYTVKTILSALDYDLEQLQHQNTGLAQEFKELFLLDVNDEKEASFLNLQLNIAWIAGLVYLISGIFEFASDFTLFEDDSFLFGKTGYILIKLITLFSYILFLRGFVLSGKIFRNYLLKIAAFLLIGVATVFYIYDIVAVFVELLDIEYLLVIEAIIYGIIGVFFGIGIFRLQRPVGTIASVSGVLEIVAGAMMLTIILGWLGLIILLPAGILEVILLFKVSAMLKEKQKEIL